MKNEKNGFCNFLVKINIKYRSKLKLQLHNNSLLDFGIQIIQRNAKQSNRFFHAFLKQKFIGNFQK